MNHSQKIDLYIRESRPVSGGKGDSTDKQAEQSSAAFSNTLQQAFTAQYGKQSAVNSFLTSKLTSMANNPTGFTAPTMAAATTSNIQNAAQTGQAATQAAQTNEAAHGGSGLPSGVNAQISGQINSAVANNLSSNQNQLQIANGELQNQNQWSALSGLQGVSNADNPLGFAGASTGAAGNIAAMSQAYTASDQSQLESTLGGIIGGVGGAFATGGLSTLMGGGKKS